MRKLQYVTIILYMNILVTLVFKKHILQKLMVTLWELIKDQKGMVFYADSVDWERVLIKGPEWISINILITG